MTLILLCRKINQKKNTSLGKWLGRQKATFFPEKECFKNWRFLASELNLSDLLLIQGTVYTGGNGFDSEKQYESSVNENYWLTQKVIVLSRNLLFVLLCKARVWSWLVTNLFIISCCLVEYCRQHSLDNGHQRIQRLRWNQTKPDRKKAYIVFLSRLFFPPTLIAITTERT